MDGGTQPRFQLYDEVVAEYAEDLRQGATFPPVIVFWDEKEKVYWLADGFHRVRAHEAIGTKEVRAEIHLGTRREAVLYSVGANATHGLRRTNADKYRAVERLLRDDEWSKWSNREISRRCGVSHDLVNRLRKSMHLSGSSVQTENFESDHISPLAVISSPTRLAQRGGTVFEIDTTNIGKTSQAAKAAKRQRAKKQSDEIRPLTVQAKQVSNGEIWKLGKFHYLYCGDPSSSKFQKLLPSEIALLLIFPRVTKSWPQEKPANVKNALLFYTSYGEDIDLRNLRQIVENCLSTTTNADEPVVIINLPDPSFFILMENLYCPCYCAEPDPQRCTDALTAWSITMQPSKKI
ncbi:MAG: ParB N-terminal domain-containing protein [Acaryochloris sp. RU_4_1]|nr:ParB N-terminal domain-containing protein [Acaryochloris sp. RU_4_1]